MTRTVNGSFSGTVPFDVDVGAPMVTSTLKEALEDQNLIHDMITGEYSTPTNMCEHIGDAKGAPLRVPIVNQPINAVVDEVEYDGYLELISETMDKTILWASCVYLPKGETKLVLNIRTLGNSPALIDYEIYDDTGAAVTSGAINSPDDDRTSGVQGATVNLTVAGDDEWYIVFFTISLGRFSDTSNQISSFLLSYVSIYPHSSLHSYSPAPPLAPSGFDDIFVDTAGAGVALVDNQISDEMISVDGRSINAKVLTAMNHNLNNKYEYITGWPVLGNLAVENDDTDDIRPTTSRFLAHTRSEYTTTEPLIQWPIFCEGFGAMGVDAAVVAGTSGPIVPLVDEALTVGCLDWFAPFPTVTAAANVRIINVYVPNLPIVNSKLQIRILFASTHGLKTTDWETRVGINGSFTSWTTMSYLSGEGAGNSLSIVSFTITSSAPTPTLDENNEFKLQIRKNGGTVTYGQIFCLGWACSYVY